MLAKENRERELGNSPGSPGPWQRRDALKLSFI